ncbi:MAG: AlkZ family DNA glycosylase [Deltaproteobacteria bacterium]|nr:AlkZ family DNA glycosylase [Deltaproteobacteria bacterium]
MSIDAVLQRRLRAQHLVEPLASPERVVERLGAVQAQDYPGARWAVVQRSSASAGDVDRALAEGRVIRTHVLRPTWHLVAPADLRWMLELSAPQIRAAMAPYLRKLDVDAKLLAKTDDAFARILEGKQLTRAELVDALEQRGLRVGDGVRMGHLLMSAEIAQLICSGGLRGKHQTYARLDERVPKARLSRDAALAELAHRFFTSHGPASLQDFAWWSGLPMGQARAALESVRPKLELLERDDRLLFFDGEIGSARIRSPHALLLPNYDEYIVAYAEREGLLDAQHHKHLDARANPLFQHTVVVDGRIVGTWKRVREKAVPKLFRALSAKERVAVDDAVSRHDAHLDSRA